MNILVTGANGQLGCSIRDIVDENCNGQNICSQYGHDSYFFSDVSARQGFPVSMLDITDLDAIRIFVRNYEIDAIVNCAAWTNVDAAENSEKYDLVESLNAKAPENLAVAMKEVNGLLVHISTDYVFGGDPYNTPCKEDQKGTPTGVYGLTKLHGEDNIMKSGVRYVIIRTAWLYSEYGKNFVKTMLKLIATKPQLKVVFDQTGTPTYAHDLASVIVTILVKPEIGIYHYSNEGVCSWFDFAKMIAKYTGNSACDIHPCHSEEYPSPVKRPAYSVLDKTKVKQTYGLTIPYWTDSLCKCIANLQR